MRQWQVVSLHRVAVAEPTSLAASIDLQQVGEVLRPQPRIQVGRHRPGGTDARSAVEIGQRPGEKFPVHRKRDDNGPGREHARNGAGRAFPDVVDRHAEVQWQQNRPQETVDVLRRHGAQHSRRAGQEGGKSVDLSEQDRRVVP